MQKTMKPAKEAGAHSGPLGRRQLVLGAVCMLLGAVAAWQTIDYTNATNASLDEIHHRNSFSNEGSQALEKFVAKHRVLGSFVAADLQRDFNMPSFQESSAALAGVPALERLAERQESAAAQWSWALLGISAVYIFLAAFLGPNVQRLRHVLFAATGVSVLFFAVGIAACALEVFTVISHFFGSTPVLQHQVRSILSVIHELFDKGHWVFGGFIALFSVVTPLAKTGLTYAAALTSSPEKNAKIGHFLTAIGKWSMADVFVAAVLLACYTLKSGQGTRVNPARGLYYFAGYCLLSMVVSSLLAKMNFSGKKAPLDPEALFGVPALAEVLGVLVFVSAILGLKD